MDCADNRRIVSGGEGVASSFPSPLRGRRWPGGPDEGAASEGRVPGDQRLAGRIGVSPLIRLAPRATFSLKGRRIRGCGPPCVEVRLRTQPLSADLHVGSFMVHWYPQALALAEAKEGRCARHARLYSYARWSCTCTGSSSIRPLRVET